MPILECNNLTKRFGSVEALTDVLGTFQHVHPAAAVAVGGLDHAGQAIRLLPAAVGQGSFRHQLMAMAQCGHCCLIASNSF